MKKRHLLAALGALAFAATAFAAAPPQLHQIVKHPVAQKEVATGPGYSPAPTHEELAFNLDKHVLLRATPGEALLAEPRECERAEVAIHPVAPKEVATTTDRSGPVVTV